MIYWSAGDFRGDAYGQLGGIAVSSKLRSDAPLSTMETRDRAVKVRAFGRGAVLVKVNRRPERACGPKDPNGQADAWHAVAEVAVTGMEP